MLSMQDYEATTSTCDILTMLLEFLFMMSVWSLKYLLN